MSGFGDDGKHVNAHPYSVSRMNCMAVGKFKSEWIDRNDGDDDNDGGGGDDGGDGGGDGGGGDDEIDFPLIDPSTDRCIDFPNTPGCPVDCELNPDDPRCGDSETCGYLPQEDGTYEPDPSNDEDCGDAPPS